MAALSEVIASNEKYTRFARRLAVLETIKTECEPWASVKDTTPEGYPGARIQIELNDLIQLSVVAWNVEYFEALGTDDSWLEVAYVTKSAQVPEPARVSLYNAGRWIPQLVRASKEMEL